MSVVLEGEGISDLGGGGRGMIGLHVAVGGFRKAHLCVCAVCVCICICVWVYISICIEKDRETARKRE